MAQIKRLPGSGGAMRGLDRVRFANAIDGLYEAAVAPELWPEALGQLSDAAGGCGSVILYSPHGGGGWFEGSPGMQEVLSDFFVGGWHDKNVRVRGRSIHRTGRAVLTDTMIFRPGELDRYPIQNQFYDQYGLRSFIGFEFVPNLIRASIERGRSEACESDVAELERAAGHFHRIGRLALARGHAHAEGVLDALTMFNCATLILDHQGRVAQLNQRAEDLLPTSFHFRQGCLIPRHRMSAAPFKAMISGAVAAKKPHETRPIAAVKIPTLDQRTLIAVAAPLEGRAHDIFKWAKAVLMLIDPDGELNLDARLLMQIFGLTRKQATLAKALSSGRDLDECSLDLEISKETARTHLSAIFAKTGTRRQAELATLLARTFRIFPRE
jgi:DNA-binding CsgD family transcriptional regulator